MKLFFIFWLAGFLVTMRQSCIQDMSQWFCDSPDMWQDKRDWTLSQVEWEKEPLCIKSWEGLWKTCK